MRLHIQNQKKDTGFAISLAQWQAGVHRHPDMASINVTVCNDDAGFERALEDAEVLVAWVDDIKERFPRGALPNAAPRLRILYYTSAGIDRLAPFDWLPDSVSLLNNSGIHSDKAGEFGIMALLMLQNRMPELIEAQRAKAWTQVFGSTLRGRTLGVVGMGSLGSGVARRARAFGMRVIGIRNGHEPHPDCDETVSVDHLDSALPRVDDLLLACPLTSATRNLLSRERIALLKKGARVVNIARGPVWDQDAICDALDAEHLDSAFTDVAVPEPPDPSHRLWRTRGLIVTPHISADDLTTYSDDTVDLIMANLRADREGKPLPNLVDLSKGY
ncbi:D-2-hydroxyacid dehydrogenase [Mesorhizobium sp. M7A.F.Ca.US.006.01.1.1]|uniref:D-2-hydroxyacid dehydrogenase n=1 Tax=Mesorhizobium sp. M7A.F.Ca.US.006.01.1.1 TaxID=2496707 RepID=UPI000FCBB208|nr:D-2-hydroxyacid dehydrogenase [Mesorhizobium sp. M7A.F.Ca.US.006.01.1.1]RUZ75993.1 D-2-hydroxyacid dehydrogenase [Mesorhizobium sp. M7A.F.Ca.US.006.01.1.1]